MSAITIYGILALIGMGGFCWLIVWNERQMKKMNGQTKLKFCTNCGKNIEDVAFCNHCGKKF